MTFHTGVAYFCITDQTDHVTPWGGTMTCPHGSSKDTTYPFHSSTPVHSMDWGSLLVADMSSANVVSDGFYDRTQGHRYESNSVDDRKWRHAKLAWEIEPCIKPLQCDPVITLYSSTECSQYNALSICRGQLLLWDLTQMQAILAAADPSSLFDYIHPSIQHYSWPTRSFCPNINEKNENRQKLFICRRNCSTP